jgi:hypothetical protein
LLWQHGVRVVSVPSPARQEYIFAGGSDCDIATFDSDFHVRMMQAPRGLAALIEQYLRAVRVVA